MTMTHVPQRQLIMWRSLCKFRIGVIVWSIRFQRCGGLFPSAVGWDQNVSDTWLPNLYKVSCLTKCWLLFFFISWRESFSFWFSTLMHLKISLFFPHKCGDFGQVLHVPFLTKYFRFRLWYVGVFTRTLYMRRAEAGWGNWPKLKSDLRPMKALFPFVSGVCRTRTARDSTAGCKCSRHFYMTPTTPIHNYNFPVPQSPTSAHQSLVLQLLADCLIIFNLQCL